MAQDPSTKAARGLTDDKDRLLSADDALADLQQRCGGALPGKVAVPELLALIKRSRQSNLRLAREFAAYDGDGLVSGFARIDPLPAEAGGGCELVVDALQRTPLDAEGSHAASQRDDAIDRCVAETGMRLRSDQTVAWISELAADGASLEAAIRDRPDQHWTQYVTLTDVSHQQPLHWRLLDGARCTIPGSARGWRVRLFPNGGNSESPDWFELLLVPDSSASPAEALPPSDQRAGATQARVIGSALTPALRQPVARIIANAETIKSRLAGPLRSEYSEYAGNIAAAGQHLTAMFEDLADLEVVEAPGFSTIREQVELGDAARRAAGILGVRAQERNIDLVLPSEDDSALATAEFRRVLQILINLLGNAISYSPEGSTVTVSLAKRKSDPVAIIVKDQGPGVTAEQAERIFDKFERLGRSDKAGSGLGLYISYRLAEAMNGRLRLTSKPGEGAKFRLELPAANSQKDPD